MNIQGTKLWRWGHFPEFKALLSIAINIKKNLPLRKLKALKIFLYSFKYIRESKWETRDHVSGSFENNYKRIVFNSL